MIFWLIDEEENKTKEKKTRNLAIVVYSLDELESLGLYNILGFFVGWKLELMIDR